MKTDTKTRAIRNFKKNVYSFYKNEDKKERQCRPTECPGGDQSQKLIKSKEISIYNDAQVTEKPGKMFDWKEVYPPHDYFTEDPIKSKAKHINGTESPFYRVYAESRKDSNEVNLSVVLGQMFDTVYPAVNTDLATGTSTNFAQQIRFNEPLNRDIFVKSRTSAFLPGEKEKVYHLDRGNLDIEEIGIEAYVQTGLNFDTDDKRLTSVSFKFHKFLDVHESDQIKFEIFEPVVYIENLLKIPAGTTEFIYTTGLRTRIYSSKDFSSLQLLDNDKFGFAMLDLRPAFPGNQTPILRDPLGAWEKQGFGGARFHILLEFYEIENILNL